MGFRGNHSFHGSGCVLILILMEDTLWGEVDLTKPRLVGSLNPYSNGRYSMGYGGFKAC